MTHCGIWCGDYECQVYGCKSSPMTGWRSDPRLRQTMTLDAMTEIRLKAVEERLFALERDRDAAPRKAESFEAEGRQPVRNEDCGSPND